MNAELRRSALIRGDPRLLLGDAVDGAHAPDKWFAIDRHYLTSREESLKRVDSTLIVCVTKHRREHDVVGDVKVCIACRQTFEIAGRGAAAADNSRHRQRYDLERLSIRVSHRSEALQIVLQ